MGDSPFLPSINGLRFANAWPSDAHIAVRVPGMGNVTVGNATKGLCGGMLFTALDVFATGHQPLPDPRPPAGSPLFRYIVRRHIDSWDLPSGVLKYYHWMNLPDADTNLGLATLHGVGRRTLEQEWPAIRADLDAGHPSPLGLVTVAGAQPSRLAQNQQVLAYGYTLAGCELTIKVYDPNTDPTTGDDVHLSLSLANPSGTTPVTHNASIGGPIRGFFRVPYTPADPRRLGI